MATPLTAAQLVAALKAEGVSVKAPHSGWTTHERDSATGKAFGPVHGVVMHHTAGHDVYDYVYNGSSALPGPLCHAYIDKAGVAWMTSAGRANHAGGGDPDVLNAVVTESYMSRPPAPKFHEGSPGAADGNDPFYGFECENLGDGKDPWPQVQYVAMVKAAAAIVRHYGWTEKSVIGHLEWSDWKSDPRGFDMKDFRADVKFCLALPAGAWPKAKEATPVSADDLKSLIQVDGVLAAPADSAEYATNKFWTWQSHIQDTTTRVRRLEEKVDQLLALLSAQK
jgi:hypothetical protein